MSQHYKLTLDLTEEGFNFLQSFQRVALQILWNHPEGLSAMEVWSLINMEMNQPTSKSNVLTFLTALVEKNILEYRWSTFDGGLKGYYWNKQDHSEITYLMEKTITKLVNTLKV